MVAAVAHRMRAFLEPLWSEWHEARRERLAAMGEPSDPPAQASRGMCRWSSMVLLDVLAKETGRTWTLKGGSVYPPLHPTGGILDAAGQWRDHYWVEAGDLLVDVTADQFGRPSVIVESGAHPLHRPNYTPAEIRQHVADARITAGKWLDAYRRPAPPSDPDEGRIQPSP